MNKQIKIHDNYGKNCIADSVRKFNGSRKPEGFVEIYDINEDGIKKLLGKHNLVVYQGREWLAQRAFDTNNSGATVPNTKDLFISWFGLGSGGTGVDPLDPTDPTNTDVDLDTEVSIHATDTACTDYRSGAYWKHPFASVTYSDDAANDNKDLIAVVQINIGTDDANGNNLSEAGLFFSDSATTFL